MKKRKIYEISVIDKTYSKTISDETKFYTSDTALELVFKLKETEYNFESAEIALLNIDDRSFTTRPVSKVNNEFVYEIDDDITTHSGEWRGQLMFVEKHVSSPIKFRIENDLYCNKPLEITEVVSWVSLKKYANVLVDELKQAVDEAVAKVETMDETFKANELDRDAAEKERQSRFENAESEREKGESIRVDTFNANETARQMTFETNESERDATFNTNEDIRQTQELEREKAEGTRQQSESQRQLTFETNESERQTTFEVAEQERQSSELIRIENEKQRNLTSVDEFIKLQNAVGGRNHVLNSNFANGLAKWLGSSNRVTTVDNMVKISSGATIVGIYQALNTTVEGETYTVSAFVRGAGRLRIGFDGSFGMKDIPSTTDFTRVSWTGVRGPSSYIVLYTSAASNAIDITEVQVEDGSILTPWKLAPNDYTVVSKEDYYNHVKLMNEFKDNQFNQLKQAVLALGGSL